MTNQEFVFKTLDWLWQHDVRDLCLCPGGRNSPFVVALDGNVHWNIFSSFDERSAGFFALGLAQRHRRPVAVIVTSGTAVAELLPAVMEAHYTRTPLILISADRPRYMRGTGAPQTVEQVGLFGSYVEKCVDMEGEFDSPKWQQTSSLHLNLCFDEPLIDGNHIWSPPDVTTKTSRTMEITRWRGQQMELSSQSELQSFWKEWCLSHKRSLFFLSTLQMEEQQLIQSWLQNWPGWIYAEGPSGLREWNHPGLLRSGDRLVQKMIEEGAIDSVVRVGGVPTARCWRNLEKTKTPVLSLSRLPFPGLSRGECFSGSLAALLEPLNPPPFVSENGSRYQRLDQDMVASVQSLLQKHPQSEPALLATSSTWVSPSSTVYVGNSLPIREWDAFAQREKPVTVIANRGANGIDGQLSSACAWLNPDKETWVWLGDLTTLYDSNALWFWQKTRAPLKLLVVNNSGGRIFERLFNRSLFYNEHQIQFQDWARQWGLEYRLYSGGEFVDWKNFASLLIEIRPSAAQTKSFWSEYESLWTDLCK